MRVLLFKPVNPSFIFKGTAPFSLVFNPAAVSPSDLRWKWVHTYLSIGSRCWCSCSRSLHSRGSGAPWLLRGGAAPTHGRCTQRWATAQAPHRRHRSPVIFLHTLQTLWKCLLSHYGGIILIKRYIFKTFVSQIHQLQCVKVNKICIKTH